MAAVSMHKSGGSLTQSSLLLTGLAMSEGHVRQIINLTQTAADPICCCPVWIFPEETWLFGEKKPLEKSLRWQSTPEKKSMPLAAITPIPENW